MSLSLFNIRLIIRQENEIKKPLENMVSSRNLSVKSISFSATKVLHFVKFLSQ